VSEVGALTMDEASWKRLLRQIRDENNNVVPVVGSRLLVGADGQSSLIAPIAKRLLAKYGLDAGILPPFRELNEAVSRIKAASPPGFRLQELYSDFDEEIRALGAAGDGATPEPIRQLAQITNFRLIVTLTPDDLLARTLRQRCSVREIVHSPKLPTSEAMDLPADWHSRSGEVYLLYLFGKSRPVPTCAIHDEDVLEYAHNVIVRGSHVPGLFLGELQQRRLLLIGCNFPDWLGRFFLRVTNKNRLAEKDRLEWMIEHPGLEESLACFLRSYSKDTEVLLDTSPVDFVAELHRRWTAERDASLPELVGSSDQSLPPAPTFFISYSRRTDLPRAEAMVDALLKLGVTKSEVWFDRTAIEPGHDFHNRILDGIRGCRYFLPLLSKAADVRDDAFVFREWHEANERQKSKNPNREFVIPIILDVDYHPDCFSAMPTKWHELDFGHAPNGVPDDRTATKLRTLVRAARSPIGELHSD
jgi:TIR domain